MNFPDHLYIYNVSVGVKIENTEGQNTALQQSLSCQINHEKYVQTKTRVAEVGKLSASAKNAFNSFVGRVVAYSRQKTLFFRVLPKLQQKGSFYLVLPSFT